MTKDKASRSGRGQAVRLPKQFCLKGKEVDAFRHGDELVLRQKPANLAFAFHLLAGLPADFQVRRANKDIPQKRRGLESRTAREGEGY